MPRFRTRASASSEVVRRMHHSRQVGLRGLIKSGHDGQSTRALPRVIHVALAFVCPGNRCPDCRDRERPGEVLPESSEQLRAAGLLYRLAHRLWRRARRNDDHRPGRRRSRQGSSSALRWWRGRGGAHTPSIGHSARLQHCDGPIASALAPAVGFRTPDCKGSRAPTNRAAQAAFILTLSDPARTFLFAGRSQGEAGRNPHLNAPRPSRGVRRFTLKLTRKVHVESVDNYTSTVYISCCKANNNTEEMVWIGSIEHWPQSRCWWGYMPSTCNYTNRPGNTGSGESEGMTGAGWGCP